MDIRLSQIYGDQCLDLAVKFHTALEKLAHYSGDPEAARQLRIQLGRWLKKQKKQKKLDT